MNSRQFFSKYLLSISLAGFLSLGVASTSLTAHEQTFVDEENAVIEVKPDGTKIIKTPDNVLIEVKPDGSKMIKKPDGTLIEVKPSGEKIIRTPGNLQSE